MPNGDQPGPWDDYAVPQQGEHGPWEDYAAPPKPTAETPQPQMPSPDPQQFSHALVYSGMMGMAPSFAYLHHDAIEKELKGRGASTAANIGNDIKVGSEDSIFGLAYRNKLPEALQNPNVLNSFVSGLTQMISDLPFFLAGATAGGVSGAAAGPEGAAVGGAMGMLAVPAMMRKVLVDGITKGKITSFGDLIQRTVEMVTAGEKGAIVGGSMELPGVGGLAGAARPVVAATLNKLQQIAAITILPKLMEGQMPSASDFGVNAALLAAMHYTLGSLGKAETETPQLHTKMLDAYEKIGVHPREIAAEALRRAQTAPADESPIDVMSDIVRERTPAAETPKETTPAPKEKPVVAEPPPPTLRPAIRIGEEVTAGDEGGNHADIIAEKEGAEEAEESGKLERGFVDRKDQFHARDEARASVRENEPETHKAWENIAGSPDAEFHSEDYNAARQAAGSTGIKNAAVDVQREQRGLPPVESEESTKRADVFAQAKEDVDSGKIDPLMLAESVNSSPRGISDSETDALNYYNRQLSDQHHSIMDAVEQARANDDPVAEKAARTRLQEIEEKQDVVERAARKAGTQSGRALRARQEMIAEDYSLSRLLQRARIASKTGEVSPEIRNRLETLSSQLEEANKKLAEYEEKKSQRDAQAVVDRIRESTARTQRKAVRQEDRVRLKAEFDGLVKGLDKLLIGRLSANPFLDPEALSILGKMAKNRVEAGISHIGDIVDDIHGQLTAIGHDVSKREIRDAISGYGKTFEMSKEAIAVALRDAKRQGRLISSLEDAQAKVIPLRSGLQRDQPTDEVRQLQRQVKSAMRESGIDAQKSQTPERQWKTSMDAVKTHLRNQIADLTRQLKTGEKTPPREGLVYDEEAKVLKAERDGLKESLRKVTGEPEKRSMSPEQRIKMVTAATEKQIAEYERRIKENDLTPAQKQAGAPETPELKLLRDRRDSLKETFRQMKEEAQPKKTPEEIANARFKTYTLKRIADMERRLKTGDFSKEPPKKTVLDPENQDLKMKSEELRRKIDDQISKQKFENMSKGEKALHYATKWRRAVLLTGWSTLGKLTNAAMQRMGITPVEELVGGVLSHIPGIDEVSKRAPMQGGGLNVSAEVKAVSQLWQKATAEDMWRELSTGQDSLDLQFGGKGKLPGEVLNLIGHLHGALKVPEKRAEFFRRLEVGLEYAKQNNLDVGDPRVQTAVMSKIESSAYDESLRAILMQENVLTSTYKVALAYLHNRGLTGKAFEAAARLTLPIVHVATNLPAETLAYTPAGLAGQTVQLFRTLFDEDRMGKSAMDNLSMHDMDNIMRGLKKGSVGLALFAVGVAFRKNISGYYLTPEEQRRGMKRGIMKIGGVATPAYLNDTPPLMAVQLAATVGHVWDHYNMKGMSGGLIAGAVQAGIELGKRVPFYGQIARMADATRTPEQSMVGLGEFAGSLIIPRLISEIAASTDSSKKRKARTPGEAIEMQIPGLREKVRHFSIRSR